MSRGRGRSLLLLLLLLALPAWADAPLERAVCYECWWQAQTPTLRRELTGVYRNFKCADDFCRGEVSYLLGNVVNDESLLSKAIGSFETALRGETNPQRKLLLEMFLGMSGSRGRIDEGAHLLAAADLAKAQNRPALGSLLRGMKDGSAVPRFAEAPIKTSLVVPPGSKFFVLGESTIHVRKGETVAVQMERTYRDWLSYQMKFDFRDGSLGRDHVLDYHEGARLRDLIALAQVKPLPVTATVAARRGETWYGPDDQGLFRFPILDDKIWYPTTKRRGDFALLTDTHGFSAMVDQAVAGKAGLALACGDNPGKMQAAYYLAQKGIDVYFPCDRQIALMLGYDAPGTALGSAPVHVVDGEVVIGKQPVRFAFGEKVVVTDLKQDSVARYHDAGARYFRALAEKVPLDIRVVWITDLKQTGLAVAEARKIGARVLGVRVRHEEDAEPVRKWLKASAKNRAVLFHSAPYPAGYALFAEFPQQVTFGDPHPRFLAE